MENREKHEYPFRESSTGLLGFPAELGDQEKEQYSRDAKKNCIISWTYKSAVEFLQSSRITELTTYSCLKS